MKKLEHILRSKHTSNRTGGIIDDLKDPVFEETVYVTGKKNLYDKEGGKSQRKKSGDVK